jgi:hypothetical protein
MPISPFYMPGRRPRRFPFLRSHLAPAVAFGWLLALASAQAGAQGAGGEEGKLRSVQAAEVNLIRSLVQQGVLGRDKAAELLRKAGVDASLLDFPGSAPNPPPAAPAAAAPAPELLHPQDRASIVEEVRDDVRSQARAQGQANPAALPEWIQRIHFGGDLRLRYLRDDFASDNQYAAYRISTSAPTSLIPLLADQAVNQLYQLPSGTLPSVTGSEEFVLLRGRLNVDARLGETLKGGLRLSAVGGNDASASPVDYDIPLGRSGRPYSAAVSLGYLQWTPTPAWELSAGRMVNPYLRTDLIFAPDLSLDGVALGYQPRLSAQWNGFLAAGVHPLLTNQQGPYNGAHNQTLLAAQAGAQWRADNGSQWRLAAAYYDFDGLQGRADPLLPTNNTLDDASAPAFRQFGNTMFNLHYQWDVNSPLYGYAGEFRLADLGAQLEWARFDPLHLSLQIDWVRNVGFNTSEIVQRLGGSLASVPGPTNPSTNAPLTIHGLPDNGVTRPRTNGYLVHLQAGAAELRQAGDWQLFGGFRYLERDAVPDAFTSPDYRLGGTDVRASYLGLNWAVSPSVDMSLRYITAHSIDLPVPFGVDSWFLDLNGHF